MRFIHYCVFCLDENDTEEKSEEEEKNTEIISFMINENNGYVSLHEFIFK